MKKIFDDYEMGLCQAAPSVVAALLVFAVLGMNFPLQAGTVNYIYDTLNRLSKVTYLDNTTITYNYDPAGNWTTNTVVMADSDSDGIPDWWMNLHFGHATGQAADNSRANDDADGDGMTNLQEFLAGTNPTDAANVLKIASGTIINTNVLISFTTVTNRTYRVESSPDLNGASWIQLPDTIIGNGNIQQVTDIGGATGPQRFYRVRLVY